LRERSWIRNLRKEGALGGYVERAEKPKEGVDVKRVLVVSALLALGTIGLVSPQVIFANPPNCHSGNGTTTEQPPPEQPVRLAPTAATATAGCGAIPITDEPDNVFLCYSKFQVDPGVWPPEVAAQLLAEGYYYPVAVPGNVPGGTNIGNYHLVCNGKAAASGDVVNQNGLVMPAEAAGDTLGYYPLGA